MQVWTNVVADGGVSGGPGSGERSEDEVGRDAGVPGHPQPAAARALQRGFADSGDQHERPASAVDVLCSMGLVRWKAVRGLVMRIRACGLILLLAPVAMGAGKRTVEPTFQTSDRCIACHNELVTPSGKDVSIGFDWRSSMMVNSSRDPYWQASVRRETIDHPQAISHIED